MPLARNSFPLPQTTQHNSASEPPRRRRRSIVLKTLGGVVGALIAAIVILALIWQWDWFVPYLDRKASAALHRPVTIAHLHVRLGLRTTVTLDDLKIGQPKGFEKEKDDFASARAVTVTTDVWRYVTGGGLSFPLIRLDTPRGDIVSRTDGNNNYSFGSEDQKATAPTQNTPHTQASSSSSPTIPDLGKIEIHDADIHVAMATLKTDMHVLIHTEEPKGDDRGKLVIDLKGRYAQAPINGHIVGGALLSLTNAAEPYPIDGRLSNGPTYITLRGTVNDPVHFKGTNLALHFAGPDMALLFPLTGVPIPHTPAYSVTGNLAYSDRAIQFEKFEGHMGSSDIGGDIQVDPHQKPIFVNARLQSHLVDLADLGGFIGAKPGKEAPATPTPSNTRVLPSTAINVPRLNAANVHLTYHGDHIRNKDWPLDNIDTELDIRDGAINLQHLTFATGTGTISAAATLTPVENQQFKTRFHMDVSRLPVSRIMTSKDLFQGHGTIGGHVTLTSTGNSVDTLVENGNGGLTLVLDRGGDVTALLPDLIGLKLGAALLSAMGISDRSKLDCLVADMPLKDGIVSTDAMMLQTSTTRTVGRGTINFHKDTLDYAVTTRSIGPQILSLPGAVNITGPINNPTILPGAELIGRVAASVGLGILFPPAALIPTIQLGVGKGSACENAVREANDHPAAGIAPGSTTGRGASSIPHPGLSSARSAAAKPAKTKQAHMTPAQVRSAWKKKTAPK